MYVPVDRHLLVGGAGLGDLLGQPRPGLDRTRTQLDLGEGHGRCRAGGDPADGHRRFELAGPETLTKREALAPALASPPRCRWAS